MLCLHQTTPTLLLRLQPRWKLAFNYSCSPSTLLLPRPPPRDFHPSVRPNQRIYGIYWKSRRNSFAFREKHVYIYKHVDAFDFRKKKRERKKFVQRLIKLSYNSKSNFSITRINYVLKTRVFSNRVRCKKFLKNPSILFVTIV